LLPAGAAHRFPGDQPDGTPLTDAAHSAYRVLARKYRPATFADLIGQEAMVRTLRNAFEADRIAHAFVLTGVRGVGKTTTARIVAKGLNCVGPDGQGGVTIEPCGVCGPCVSIAEGRHVDVLEMDAATHTQVEKMRDLLASVPYRPTDVRYKVYIIDEVHMLSTSAFNALLKTLEEPPAHVKFIFATTEIRKVPVTVLSRCQRFEDVAALVRARRDVSLLIEIEQGVRLVKYAPGRIEFEPADGAAPDLAARLGQRLQLWTGVRWGVSVVGSGGAATIAELREAERAGLHARAAAHPMVQAVLAAFPGAEIREVRTADGPEAGPAVLAPAPEAGEDEDDEWDPFDPASEE